MSVVRRVVSATSAQAWRGGKVQVALATTATALWTSIDEGHLAQALALLLHHAARSTSPGGAVVVRSKHLKTGVAIQVRVSEEERQIDARPSPPEACDDPQGQAGYGANLASARQIVKALGGALIIENIPGEGKCFTIELPP